MNASATRGHLHKLFESLGWQPGAVKHAPFTLICGPNVVESATHLVAIGQQVKAAAQDVGLPLLFKSSFDKANRTSPGSFRGIGFEPALDALRRARDELAVPIVTDIHESWQARPVADVADVLQIPAFLCRQTDLLHGAGRSGRVVLIKKGQFASTGVMKGAVDKINEVGSRLVMVCERGNSFGYGDLVVDFKNLLRLRREIDCLVAFDASHSAQLPPVAGAAPAGEPVVTRGDPEVVRALARAAVAVGVDAIFLEVHDNPKAAPVERHTQLPVGELPGLLRQLVAIANASSVT